MSDSTHTQMWENLNLDLPAHYALLEVLGKFYGDIYLSQENRLQGAEYLDFVLSEVHGLRIKELQDAKAEGRKVVGSFCVFVPEEMTLAADAVHVGLCAGGRGGHEPGRAIGAAQHLRSDQVPSSASRWPGCVPSRVVRLIVGETTCDGKKKAYEAFNEIAPTYVMEVPQTKTQAARALWRSEIVRYMAELEKVTGRTITAEKLAQGIKTANAKRRALQRLTALRAASPAPISGRDALLINQISFYDEPVRFTAKINELCDELEGRIKAGQGVAPANTPRLMLSGCPMAVPNWKLPYVVESAGAVIVGEESCIGTRNSRDLTDESGTTLEAMIDAIADRYMKIDCACFTPQHRTAGQRHQLGPKRSRRTASSTTACSSASLTPTKPSRWTRPWPGRASPCSPSRRTTPWRTWNSSRRASRRSWRPWRDRRPRHRLPLHRVGGPSRTARWSAPCEHPPRLIPFPSAPGCWKGCAPLPWSGPGYGPQPYPAPGPGMPALVHHRNQGPRLGRRPTFFTRARSVLDIGGQDTKAIALAPGQEGQPGRVLKFEMNDRCAAGTGKFLEYTAGVFQIPVEQFGAYALKGTDPPEISSMCTVFAETEATSLMARGTPPESIALGLHKAIVQTHGEHAWQGGLCPAPGLYRRRGQQPLRARPARP